MDMDVIKNSIHFYKKVSYHSITGNYTGYIYRPYTLVE